MTLSTAITIYSLAFAGVGTPELIVIAIIVLVLFGSRLPSVMKNLGSSVSSFKKGMKDGEEEADRLDPPRDETRR